MPATASTMATGYCKRRNVCRQSWISQRLLHTLTLSLCITLGSCNISGSGSGSASASGSALQNPISNLTLESNENELTLTANWSDSAPNVVLDYLFNYTATVDTTVIVEESVIVTLPDSEISFIVFDAWFVQSGVTITVTVQARVDSGLCDALIASLMMSGDFSPSPEDFTDFTLSSASIQLSWTIPFPQVLPDGFILNYTINQLSGTQPETSSVYLVIDSDDTDLVASGSGESMYDYVLEGLTAHTEYTFSLSSNYSSAISDVVTAVATTNEDISGPVTNLTADFTTTSTLSFNITIMWNAPVQPNGDILRYDYSLTETETAAVRISGNTTELSVNDLPLTDVEPYTSYTVTVVAVNSVGDGESANITLLSPETEPGQVSNLDASFNATGAMFNSTTRIYTLDIVITWDEPSNPNGVITFYEVNVTQTDDSGIVVYSNSSLPVPNVIESVMVLPFTNYTVTVAASTSAGQGDEVAISIESPEAEPSQVNNLDASFDTTGSAFNSTTRMYTVELIIVWYQPSYPNGVITSYEVVVTQTDDSSIVVYSNSSLPVPNVTESVMVLPFTNYTVSVAASTSAGQGDRSVFIIESPEAVPSQVEVLDASFIVAGAMFDASARKYTLDIDITWNEPMYPNGVITFYEVNVTQTDDSSTVVYSNDGLPVPNVTESVMVLPFTDYTVTVAASTSAGQGDPDSVIVLSPEASPGPVEGLEAMFIEEGSEFNNSTRMYTLEIDIVWYQPSYPNGVIMFYEVNVTQTDDSGIVVYSNSSLPVPNVTESVMVLPFTNYTVTVAASTSAGQGEAHSITIESPEAEPGQVRNLDANFSTGTFNPTTRMYTLNISVEWNEPTYPNGDITSYSVIVYQTENSSDIYSDTLALTYVTQSVMVLPFTNYTVTVAASTSARQGEGTSITIESPEAAPDPVENLNDFFNDTGASFNPSSRMYTLDIVITWDEPSNPNGIITFYEVNVTQTDDSGIVVYSNSSLPVPNVTESVMVLPFTNYTVTVAASTSAGQGDEVAINIESPEAEPGRVRNLVASFPTIGRMFNSTSNMYTINIDITWDEPVFPNGIITSYEVNVTRTDDLNDVVYSDNSLPVPDVTESVMVLPFTNYTVTVAASTSAGQGEAFSIPIESPEAAPSAPRNVAVVPTSSTSLTVSWSVPDPTNGVITGYRVTISGGGAVSIALRDADVMELNIADLTPFTNYTVFVEASTVDYGEMSDEVTVVTLEDAPTVPTAVMAVAVNSTAITVTWGRPDTPNGIIRGYNISYLLPDSGDEVVINVEPIIRTVTVGDLSPFTSYEFTVAAFTIEMGPGETVNATTDEAVPGQVQDLQASFGASTNFNSTSRVHTLDVVITWNEPTTLNGVITFYEVNVTQTDDSSIAVYSNDRLNVLSITESVMVLPFTNYTVTVAASTSAGQGEGTSITIKSPEAASGQVEDLGAMFVSDGSAFDDSSRMYTLDIVITWDEPSDPNGIVTFYEVNVTQTDDSSILVYSDDSITVLAVTESVIVLPFTDYTVTVAASTSAGQGDEVAIIIKSPEAEPGQVGNLNASFTASGGMFDSISQMYTLNIDITWDEPMFPNGIITSYEVNVIRTDDPNDVVYSNDSITDSAVTESVMVLPFTNYTVTVAASTSAGQGEAFSITIESPQAAPSAPRNVTVVPTSSTSLAVSWSVPDPTNGIITGYRVTYFVTSGGAMQMPVQGADEMGFNITGLTPFTEYMVSVQARTVDYGERSDEVTVVTLEDAPTVPTAVMAVVVNSTAITVTWEEPVTPNGVIRGYNISYSLPDSGDEVVINVEPIVRTVTVGDLSPFTFYEFTVAAFTIEMGPGETVSVTTDQAAPTAPLNLEVVTITAFTISLQWDEPQPANGIITSYIVRYYRVSNPDDITLFSVTIEGTMAEVTGLRAFTDYVFRVSAETVEEGGFSEITQRTDESTPSAPLNVVARNTSSTSILVEWSPPATPRGVITSYSIAYYVTTAGAPGALTMSVGGSATSGEIGTLMKYTEYSVYVVASTAVGSGDQSDTVTVFTDEDVPSVPRDLNVIVTGPTSITVSWSSPSSPNGILLHYNVVLEREIDGSFEPHEMATVPAIEGEDSYSLPFNELLAFTLYRIAVSAETRIGAGPDVQYIVTTDPSAASPPSFVSAKPLNSTSIQLLWGYPDVPRGEITGYIIFHNMTDAGEQMNIPLSPVNDMQNQTQVFGDLLPFTYYEFSVGAVAVTEEQTHFGMPSEPVIVRTPEDIPSVPVGFTLGNVTDEPNQLFASWSEPQPPNGVITAYTLTCTLSDEQYYPEQSSSMPPSMTIMIDGGMTHHTVTGLQPFTNYECRVTASTSVGEGPPSDTETQRTVESTPSAPLNFMLMSGDAATELLASWQAPIPANGIITTYTLYCMGSESQFYTDQISPRPFNLTLIGSLILSTRVMGLLPFTKYDCSVAASTSAGEGDRSSTVMQRTEEAMPSDSPQSFSAVALNSTSIQLSWSRPGTPNGEISHYTIVYSTDSGAESMTFSTTNETMNVTDLNEYTNYTFEITANTSAGFGPATQVTETTHEDVPSAGVVNLTGVFSSSSSLLISWQPPPPDDQNGVIRAYNITYGISPQDRSQYASESTTGLTIELTSLEKFTEYTVFVAAFTIATGPEESVTVRTDSDLPSAPLNLRYVNITAASIRLFWEPPARPNGDILSYKVMYVEFGTGETVMIEYPLEKVDVDVGVVLEPLMEYHVYVVTVAASTDKGFGNYSLPLDVLTDEHEPDAPENFTAEVINSTSVLTTWDNPLDANGIIVSFSLRVSLTPGRDYLPPPVAVDPLDADQFELLITGLHPFARYVFFLSAATSFGPGNKTDTFATTDQAAPSQGVQGGAAPVISPNEVHLMWMPPELENWNGNLTSYTIDIMAVDDCQNLSQLQDFPNSPRMESLSASNFQTCLNPTDAYSNGGIREESLIVGALEEYQSYLFSIRVWNNEGSSPEDDVVSLCNRTQEAAPTGQPSITSFLITSNTTALVSWQPPPPLEQNGVIVNYSVELCSNRTGRCEYFNTGSDDTFYDLQGLTPFTLHTVSVAALTSQGQGPKSTSETNTTFQGLPSMPSGLVEESKDHDFISLSWMPPDTPYGIVETYRVAYEGFKDESLIGQDSCDITDEGSYIEITPMLTITLNDNITGDSQYCIHVTARTVAGYGNISCIVVDVPVGPPPVDVIDPETDPDVVPKPVDDGVSATSANIEFTLPTEINMNGPVERAILYVRQMPSSNQDVGTWYESNRASSNWPQYGAVNISVTVEQRARRATGGIPVTATIGNDTVTCGPGDIICNGPLTPAAEYGVRYTLYSGDQSQEFPFFSNAVFTTKDLPADDTSSSNTSSNVGAIVGGVVAAMLVLLAGLVILAVYCFMAARRRGTIELTSRTSSSGKHRDRPLLPRKNGSTSKPAPFLGPSDPGIVPLGEIKNASFTKSRSSSAKSNSRRLMLKDLGETVRQMLDDAGYIFSEEYERVTEVGLEHSKEASLMAENRAKNRYTNILAYDHSRVKLSYVDDDPGSDYINASYIPGYRMRRAYIATQGPLPATFDDFWRMVWEQNTHTIVMLTQLVERGRTKCHRYWPGAECIVYGEIAVEMLSEKEKEDWTVREFKLSMEKSSRTVWHYQFTSWPDHGVPDTPTAALDFVKTVRDNVLMNHGPIVVHCSAGVGRTGCFIALDTLLQHIEEHDYIDIYGLASEMRQHRNHMIQTEAQYVLVHKAMVEFVEAHYTGKSPIRFAFPSLYTNPFAEDSTQMTDYYGDFLSEETHM